MKKFLFTLFCISLLCFSSIVLAADTPMYDATFNNNQGAFFANGTPITITEGTTTDTVLITWISDSLEVPSTTRIFGGGIAGTNYETSNVTLESGNVSFIYGGGFSTNSGDIATVETTNVVINGGSVTTSLYGGGLLYTTVNTSNVTINNGTVNSVLAGGASSSTISGISYSTGTEDNPIASGTRVDNGNLTINGGVITDSAWGGGQGYSYTGSTNVTINSGDLSSAYLTAGGSNGYTGDSNVRINGGSIDVYQTTNRGIVESNKTLVTGGNINTFYVGGEDEVDVTGSISSALIEIVGGSITNLNSGISNSLPIDFSGNNFDVAVSDETVVNNNIPPENFTTLTYTFIIPLENITLFEGTIQAIPYEISVIPENYSELINEIDIVWASSDPSVATVNENGIITGISEGTAIITGTFANQSQNVIVTVNPAYQFYLIWALFIIIFFILTIYFTRERDL